MIYLQDISFGKYQNFSVEHLSLNFESYKIHVIWGPHKSGKTSILKIMSGLICPDTGEVIVGNEHLNIREKRKNLKYFGIVPMGGGLFPHLTNYQNIMLGIQQSEISEPSLSKKIDRLSEFVQIDKKILGNYPVSISEEEKIKIGLMRALLIDPHYLLLDDPLGSLDPLRKMKIQKELSALLKELTKDKTIIYTTRDVNEGVQIGDTLTLMDEGHVLQHGAVLDVVKFPVHERILDIFRAGVMPKEIQDLL